MIINGRDGAVILLILSPWEMNILGLPINDITGITTYESSVGIFYERWRSVRADLRYQYADLYSYLHKQESGAARAEWSHGFAKYKHNDITKGYIGWCNAHLIFVMIILFRRIILPIIEYGVTGRISVTGLPNKNDITSSLVLNQVLGGWSCRSVWVGSDYLWREFTGNGSNSGQEDMDGFAL